MPVDTTTQRHDSDSPPPLIPLQEHESIFGDPGHDEDDMPPLASDSDTSSEQESHPVHSGDESDSSLPSLQTVTDSSDLSSGSDEDESEDEDDFGLPYSSPPPLLPFSDQQSREPSELWPSLETSRPPMSIFDDDDEVDRDARESLINNLQQLRARAISMQISRPDVRSSLQVLESLERALLQPDAMRWVVEEIRQRELTDNYDARRADTLLTALEVIPEELVRRYEKLRSGHQNFVDCCAICRDEFLPSASSVLEDMSDAEVAYVALSSAMPYHPLSSTIVAFLCPGKHLFHDECLRPWLARKTTCPSCRFDIDPHSLTLSRLEEPGEAAERSTRPARRAWVPPQSITFQEWLDEEEDAQRSGRSRSYPAIVPEPFPELELADLADDEGEADGSDDDDDEDTSSSYNELSDSSSESDTEPLQRLGLRPVVLHPPPRHPTFATGDVHADLDPGHRPLTPMPWEELTRLIMLVRGGVDAPSPSIPPPFQ